MIVLHEVGRGLAKRLLKDALVETFVEETAVVAEYFGREANYIWNGQALSLHYCCTRIAIVSAWFVDSLNIPVLSFTNIILLHPSTPALSNDRTHSSAWARQVFLIACDQSISL